MDARRNLNRGRGQRVPAGALMGDEPSPPRFTGSDHDCEIARGGHESAIAQLCPVRHKVWEWSRRLKPIPFLLALLLSWTSGAGAEPTIRALIVTGIDYPGHHWWKTTPVLETHLTQDPRIRVEVLKDPYRLGSADLSRHDVLLLHFMNWEKPDPDEAARENLRRFVERGGGLVVIHFACGAFQGWPEYARLIGRVYDRTNTHDPRGPFTVNLVNTNHPITRGLGASFETDDELYICLTGDKPIELLAAARSKVTKRDHPMGFVHRYGQGRVFLTPLGHDARALEAKGTAEMIRRATAWAAGREPLAAQAAKPASASQRVSSPEP